MDNTKLRHLETQNYSRCVICVIYQLILSLIKIDEDIQKADKIDNRHTKLSKLLKDSDVWFNPMFFRGFPVSSCESTERHTSLLANCCCQLGL